jgi:hypothetical protein
MVLGIDPEPLVLFLYYRPYTPTRSHSTPSMFKKCIDFQQTEQGRLFLTCFTILRNTRNARNGNDPLPNRGSRLCKAVITSLDVFFIITYQSMSLSILIYTQLNKITSSPSLLPSAQ